MTPDAPPYPMFDTSNSKRYLVGPAIEVGLPLHFAFEVDALYSRLGETVYYPFIANEYDVRTIANSWEFPLLAKYRLPVPRVHPYLSGGVAPRRAGGAIHTIHYGYYPSDVTFSSMDWHAHDYAFVLGGGFEVHMGRLRISPGVRYLRWRIPSRPSDRDTTNYINISQNEAQVLLEIGWRAR